MSLAELLLHYQPCTRLDLLLPQVADYVEDRQAQQKSSHDHIGHQRQFIQGQTVSARNLRKGERWLSGRIEEITSPVSYSIQLDDGHN